MIVWGGSNFVGDRFDTGGRYTPGTDGWIATSTNAPARSITRPVWTGSEMIVWGGYDGAKLSEYWRKILHAIRSNTNPHSHGNCYSDAKPNANAYSYSYSHAYTYGYSYAYAYTHSDSHTHAYANRLLNTPTATPTATATATHTPTATPTPTPTPPTVHPAFFNGETALGGGWYYLQFANGTPFGYYSYLH